MKHPNISKRTPVGYIPLYRAIKLIAETLYGEGWDNEVPNNWQPFQLVTKRAPNGEIIHKNMIHYEMVNNSKGKQRPKKFVIAVDNKEFEKQEEYSDSIYIIWKKIKILLEKKELRIKIFSADSPTYELYTYEDIGETAWLERANTILHTGYVPIGNRKKSALWGTLFLNKYDISCMINKIEHKRITRERKKTKKFESSLQEITEMEMQRLRNYLEYLVEMIKNIEPSLFRISKDNQPWILLTLSECDNFLKALSHAHGWKYKSDIHFKEIKNYKVNGVDFLKKTGLGLKGKHRLNLKPTDSRQPGETRRVAAETIEAIQAEICQNMCK